MSINKPFGCIPHTTPWKKAVLGILGAPILVRRLQAPVIMRMLCPQEDDLILDAGCGEGFFAFEIARKSRCIGIDWSMNGNHSHVMHESPAVSFMRGDVQRIPFKDGTFDKILLSSVVQMVSDDGALLKECHRVLKKDGVIVLSVPDRYIHFKGLNERKEELNRKFGANKGYYSEREICGLMQSSDFHIEEVERSPKRVGSLLCELQLLLLGTDAPLFNVLLFPLLYSLGYMDRFASSDEKGCELVIKASAGKE